MTVGRKLAVVTGASSGIGLELARCAVRDGCDVILCADDPELEVAAGSLLDGQVSVRAVQADLGTEHGLAKLWDVIGGLGVDYLCANAGRGLGHAFLDQDWDEVESVMHVNVTGTTALLHRMAQQMKARGEGRILVTGSIAGMIPGSYQAVYNATKAYLDTLSWGIRNELKDTGVTVSCLMPGPTDTEFFARAHMEDTPVGKDDGKDDPAMVAEEGWSAMKKGRSGVTTGFMNKVQKTFSGIIPDAVLAKMHRDMARPDGEKTDG